MIAEGWLWRAAKRGECDVRGDYADAGDALPDLDLRANVPQLDVQVDRDKAKAQGYR